MDLELYSYWRSSCSWRVRIALHHKGLGFHYEPIHLVRDGGEQHSGEYRLRNPMEEVPVLYVQGEPLSQSMAILEYIEEVHPEPALLPKSPMDRARVRQLVQIISSGIQPIQNLGVMQKLAKDYGLDKPATQKWSKDWISRGLGAFAQAVASWGGRYSYGDEVSLADCCLVPQLYNARRFGVDLGLLDRLVAIESELSSQPAFVAAHPDAQPDAQS
jgi:maleylpyruvate isomerase